MFIAQSSKRSMNYNDFKQKLDQIKRRICRFNKFQNKVQSHNHNPEINHNHKFNLNPEISEKQRKLRSEQSTEEMKAEIVTIYYGEPVMENRKREER